jgi:stearoyl-CoA desaturase (delta-9 desaturase)
MFAWYWSLLFLALFLHFRYSIFTIFLHRGKTHGCFEFTPKFEQFCKFILWLGAWRCYGNWIQEFVAIHRYHHKHSDSNTDLHSPYHLTLRELYQDRIFLSKLETKVYAWDVVTPKDWMQKNIYNQYKYFGIILLSMIFLLFFGPIGFAIALSYLYLQYNFVETFIFDYANHKWGFSYVGNQGEDKSKILFPIGFLFGGEELHTNHHNNPRSPKFSQRWFEFDAGWMWTKIFMWLGLVKLQSTKLK